MYLLFNNSTYYKYNIYKSKVYRFDFPQLLLLKLEIDINRTIWFK